MDSCTSAVIEVRVTGCPVVPFQKVFTKKAGALLVTQSMQLMAASSFWLIGPWFPIISSGTLLFHPLLCRSPLEMEVVSISKYDAPNGNIIDCGLFGWLNWSYAGWSLQQNYDGSQSIFNSELGRGYLVRLVTDFVI